MTLLDWLHFWIGDAAAIERLAGNPWTLAVGALLVLSAGLARNHDVHDLVAQGWRLLLPFAASMLAAAILYGVLWLVASESLVRRLPFWSLLGLFWLTAPLAWLYGLPYERIWSRQKAADRRHAALAVVSLARVAIMTRCVVVLGQGDVAVSLAIVGGFLVPMAAIALLLTSALVRDPEERPPAGTVQELRRATTRLGEGMAMIPQDVESVPMPPSARHGGELELSGGMPVGAALGCGGIVLIAAFLVLLALMLQNRWRPLPIDVVAQAPSLPMWTLALGANVFWLAQTLRRQPAQRRRSHFVECLQTGDLHEGLRELDRRTPADFPPHWDPAAVLARRPYLSRFLDAVIASRSLPETSWVRAAFRERFERVLPRYFDAWDIWLYQDNRATESQLRDLERVHELLASWPAAATMLAPQREYLHQLVAFLLRHDPPRGKILEHILALAVESH